MTQCNRFVYVMFLFSLNTVKYIVINRNMGSQQSLCGICKNENVTKHAVIWCSECHMGLCEACTKHHKDSVTTCNHDTMHIKEYRNLNMCKLHKEQYHKFCTKHDCPCCPKCVVDHHSVCRLSNINDICKGVKFSVAFVELEQTLKEVSENFQKIRKDRHENLSSLVDDRLKIEKEIQQKRKAINDHLDQLQKEIMNQLNAVEEAESIKIRHFLKSVDKTESEIDDFRKTVANFKQHESELNTFLAMKQIECGVVNTEAVIQSLSELGGLENIKINCEIEKVLSDFSRNIHQVGEIMVESTPCNITIENQKKKYAQMLVDRPLYKIALSLSQTVTTIGTNIRGCVTLPNGQTAFSCNSTNKILVNNEDGSVNLEFQAKTKIFDMVYNTIDNTVVVSSGDSSGITIVDLRRKLVKKHLTTGLYATYGIDLMNGFLVYCAKGDGLRYVSLSDELENYVVTKQLAANSYVATFDRKFYYTNPDLQTVTCCDLNGTTKWIFKNQGVLRNPLGISLDNDGNIYVVGNSSNNVVLISPDGQYHRQILSKDDGLVDPHVLHYDCSSNKLLVANQKNTAFLFDVLKS